VDVNISGTLASYIRWRSRLVLSFWLNFDLQLVLIQNQV